MTKTSNAIANMLCQNTGSSFLDSGAVYGYNYDANKQRNFDAEPAGTVSYKYGSPEFTLSLYHYLLANYSFNEELSVSYWEFDSEHEDLDYSDTLELWCAKHGYKVENSHYTYNFDNDLDQNFIFFSVRNDETEEGFVVIQSHNGCDARGGFSKPYIFDPSTDEGVFGTGHARATVGCNQCDSFWDRDGSKFEPYQTKGGFDGGETLDDLQFAKIDSDEYRAYLSQIEITEIDPSQMLMFADYHPETIVNNRAETLIVGYDDEGNGYCPYCGGKLWADVFLGE